MTGEATDPAGFRSPALNYVVVCGAALVVMVLLLLARGQSPLVCLLLMLAGVLGVLTRMSLAPLTLLLLLAVAQLMQQLNWIDFRWRWETQTGATFVVSDVLVSMALLAYTIGHYRLQGLSRHIFPPDIRLRVLHRYARSMRTGGVLPPIERKRAAGLVTVPELLVLVLTLPVWVLLAQLAWLAVARTRDVLARQHHAQDWELWQTRLVVLLTVLVGGMVTVAAVLRYVRCWRMTADEARLMVQDTLWQETRGEQRWFARWLTWFALDQQERKDRS